MTDFNCGANQAAPVQILGAGSTPVTFFVTGADPTLGGTAGQVITVAANYTPGFEFIICIESAAPIEVQLANGNDFTITTVQATAYLGRWYPAKLLQVYLAGTTGTFSTGR